MKSKLIIPTIIAISLLLGGCATSIPQGSLYTDVTLPSAASSNAAAKKIGKSKCKSYFGLVTIGDAGIEAAKRNGGITKVASADFKAKSILGIIGEYECIVRGE